MTISEQVSARVFPPFSLTRLLKTTFEPKPGQKICILIDLEDPSDIVNFKFLKNPDLSIQRNAITYFYEGLKNGAMKELGLVGGEIFAYEVTGGSNLDLPDRAVTPEGKEVSLERDVYPVYDIILCISTYSATAPLTAHAKKLRLSRGDASWSEPDDSQQRTGRRLPRGECRGGKAASWT